MAWLKREIFASTTGLLTLVLIVIASSAHAESFSLEEARIADVHAAMRDGRLTARRLVEMYLDRIDAYDKKGPALNAVILVNPRALATAEDLDTRFRASGPVGPLHGIPVLLKDNVDTADLATTAGSLSLKGYVPPEDAQIVKRLRDAGAIILGKMNLHEFAVWGKPSAPAASCRSRGRASGGPQWRCRIRDGLPGHHGTRRLFQADHHRGDRRSGGHRVPRSPMERAGADPHRPRLRAGDELSSATAQYAQLGVKRPAIGGSSSKIIAPTNRIEPTMMA
jgi:hypothetical protein